MPHKFWFEYGYGPVITLTDFPAEIGVGCLMVILIEVTAWYWKSVFHLSIVLFYSRFDPGFQQDIGKILTDSYGPLPAGVRLVSVWLSQRRFKKGLDYLVFSIILFYGLGTTAVSLVGPWQLTQKSDRNPMVLASGDGQSRIWVQYSNPDSPYDYMPGESDENMLNQSLAGEAYYRNCYEGVNNPQCKHLRTHRLTWNDFRGIACPFVDKTVCYAGSHTAYRLETNPILVRDLGLNIKEDVTFKRRTTCAPLSYYHWAIRIDGEIFKVDGRSLMSLGRENSNAAASFVLGELTGQGVNDYVLRVRQFYHGSNILDRRLDLVDTPGDWNIVVINAMGITFETMANDPVFIVNKTQPIKIADLIRQLKGLPITPKYMTDTFGIVSCIDQYEICLRGPLNCTGLRPISKFGDDMNIKLWKDHDENSTHSLEVQAALHALHQPIKLSSIGQVLAALGTSAMAIRRTGLINHEYQRRVDDDSWMKEIDKWFGLGLAAMQIAVVGSMLGNPNKSHEVLVDVLEQTPKVKKQIEHLILYKDGEYTNINGLGLLSIAIVIVLGSVLRAFNGPFIRWISANDRWLAQTHVRALDASLLEEGWETRFWTAVQGLCSVLLAGLSLLGAAPVWVGEQFLWVCSKLLEGVFSLWRMLKKWRRVEDAGETELLESTGDI